MTIDERIEALMQSVEPLSQMHQDSERTYNRLFNQLARIAESREQGISALENGDEDKQ